MRSRKSFRWGDVNRPVRYPAADSAEAIRCDTEPLPLVPATCTLRKRRCGTPRSLFQRDDAVEPRFVGAAADVLKHRQRAIEKIQCLTVVHPISAFGSKDTLFFRSAKRKEIRRKPARKRTYSCRPEPEPNAMRLVPEEPRSRAAFSLSDAEQGQDIRSPQTKASAGTGKPETGLPRPTRTKHGKRPANGKRRSGRSPRSVSRKNGTGPDRRYSTRWLRRRTR